MIVCLEKIDKEPAEHVVREHNRTGQLWWDDLQQWSGVALRLVSVLPAALIQSKMKLHTYGNETWLD